MASFFESGPLPDWKEIKAWLGKDIPWNLVERWEKDGDGEWLDKFVKRLLKEDSPAPETETRSLARIDTVKSAKKVSVTVRIPPETVPKDLRLFAMSDRLRITGLPNGRSQIVRLPCRVFPRSGRAAQSGGRIVIHFRRRPAEEDEVELFIRP